MQDYYPIVFCLICLVYGTYSQNIVINGDFETHPSLTTKVSGVNPPVYQHETFDTSYGWYEKSNKGIIFRQFNLSPVTQTTTLSLG